VTSGREAGALIVRVWPRVKVTSDRQAVPLMARDLDLVSSDE
jgi:hypothetical protein